MTVADISAAAADARRALVERMNVDQLRTFLAYVAGYRPDVFVALADALAAIEPIPTTADRRSADQLAAVLWPGATRAGAVDGGAHEQPHPRCMPPTADQPEQDEPDAGTDIRRLIDAGYEVTFSRFPADGDYFAEIKSEFGSAWQGLGSTPGEALRSVWPLGYGNGQGGCGHCGGLGCDAEDCAVCAAYTDKPGNGVCGVCSIGAELARDDNLNPYCSACGSEIGHFPGDGDGWQHWMAADDGTIETYDAGHAAAVAWRRYGR